MSGLDRLPAAVAGPDADPRVWVSGTIVQIYADGTVDVDLGRGPVTCEVLGSYAPRTGDVVAVLRQTVTDGARPLVLGDRRTSNATTVDVQSELAVVWDVKAAPAPPPADSGDGGKTGSSGFNAVSTRSWRSGTGWSRDEVYQGVFASQYGSWVGCYFYGTAIRDALKGVTVTRCRLLVRRLSEGGRAGGVPTWVGRHAHASQPGGAPIQVGGRGNVGSLAWGASGTFDLPVAWGQSLVDGGARGILHADTSFGDYAIYASKAQASDTGRLIIDWTT